MSLVGLVIAYVGAIALMAVDVATQWITAGSDLEEVRRYLEGRPPETRQAMYALFSLILVFWCVLWPVSVAYEVRQAFKR